MTAKESFLRIHIPATYPSESLILFVFSTWHVLVALLISRVGVLRRAALSNPGTKTSEVSLLPEIVSS